MRFKWVGQSDRPYSYDCRLVTMRTVQLGSFSFSLAMVFTVSSSSSFNLCWCCANNTVTTFLQSRCRLLRTTASFIISPRRTRCCAAIGRPTGSVVTFLNAPDAKRDRALVCRFFLLRSAVSKRITVTTAHSIVFEDESTSAVARTVARISLIDRSCLTNGLHGIAGSCTRLSSHVLHLIPKACCCYLTPS